MLYLPESKSKRKGNKTMELFFKKLANLLSVKSLVTLALTVTFCVLTVTGNLPENFMNIYTMVITFYFVKQLNKEDGDVSQL